MSQRVVFVEPAAASNTFSRFMSIPLLGPLYLATIAHENGYDAAVLNENILRRPVSDEELRQADQLCLSCLTATIEAGLAIAERYRQVRTAANLPSQVHIGGIHASMLPEEVAPYADHVVIGEGENVIVDLLAGRIQERIIRGTPVADLDTLPVPDFSLLAGWRNRGIWPVMTSRGCPFDCNFCSVTEMFGRGYRAQSPERVMREVRERKKGYVFFVDDNFAAIPRRLEAILDRMEEEQFDRLWSAQVRTDITKRPELVRRMKERGCDWVYVGFESVNPESLKDMGKAQSVEDIRRAVRVFRTNSIRVHGMFMFGNDPDTTDVFRATDRFARQMRIDTVQYHVLTPLPGTRLFRRLEAEGRLLHRRWSYYDGLHVVFKPKHMTPKELQQGMVKSFKRFYTYSRAFSDAVTTTLRFCRAVCVRTLASRPAWWPTFYGTLIKFAGRGLLKQWLRENRSYLRSLSQS